MTVKVKSIVSKQLPEFVRDDHPAFVAFLQAYYDYLDQSQQRNLSDLRDLDKTVDSFVEYFKAELNVFGESNYNHADKIILLRKIKQYFTSKGSEAAYRFLFRILFDKPINITYPWDQVLKASDGKWKQDTSIFVKVLSGSANTLVGNKISVTSNTLIIKLFVERIVEYKTGVYEVFIDKNFYGTLGVGNIVSYGSFTGKIIPTTINYSIINRGAGYKVGDLITGTTISGSSNINQLLKVIAVDSNGGIVRLNTVEFGAGYSGDFYLLKSKTVFNSDSTIKIGDLATVILSAAPISNAHLFVSSNGVLQETASYTLSGGALTLGVLAASDALEARTISGCTITTNTFTGDGSTTIFALGAAPSSDSHIFVSINGIVQDISTYSLSGTSLIFATAPVAGKSIETRTLSGVTITPNTFTGDNINTTFTLSATPANDEYVFVYINGVFQNSSVYSLSGTSLIFATAPTAGVAIETRTLSGVTIISNLFAGNNVALIPKLSLPDNSYIEKYEDYGFIIDPNYWALTYTNPVYAGSLIREFYTETPNNNANTTNFALIKFTIGALAKYQGYYISNDGFLDDAIKIQDSKYYQKYSYLITVDERLEDYKTILKSYIHSAGLAVFAEYQIQSTYTPVIEGQIYINEYVSKATFKTINKSITNDFVSTNGLGGRILINPYAGETYSEESYNPDTYQNFTG